jgi:hypothetical protein
VDYLYQILFPSPSTLSAAEEREPGWVPIPGLTTALRMGSTLGLVEEEGELPSMSTVDSLLFETVLPEDSQSATTFSTSVNTTDSDAIAVGKRKRRSAKTLTRLDYPGWYTQYKKPYKGITRQPLGEIFVGFGNCPRPEGGFVNLSAFKKASENKKKLIDYYLYTLRADCLPYMTLFVGQLLDIGIISFSLSKKAFEINQEHHYLYVRYLYD